ncbi:MAG: FHA domain-containing protein [Myxococcota bacterium]
MQDDSAYLFWTDAHGGVRRTRVGQRPVTMGSGRMCVVSLPEGGAAAVHAVVEREHDRYVVRRLSRTHDLVVGDGPVEEATLRHGDRIHLGDAEVIFLESRVFAPSTLELSLRLEDRDTFVHLEIPGTITVLGRSEGDVLVDDASVSRHHLEIENFGDGMRWVRDLDSTNGSELNGEPLEHRMPLEPGDLLRAGRVLVKVEAGGEIPEALESPPQQRVTFDEDRATA